MLTYFLPKFIIPYIDNNLIKEKYNIMTVSLILSLIVILLVILERKILTIFFPINLKKKNVFTMLKNLDKYIL